MSIIFHIDVNSAYLSWTAVEELKAGGEVDIRSIPAIIGGDQQSRHGVVLAKSLPAKKHGIRTGEPVANAFRKCPSLVTRRPDHRLYKEYSERLMEFLRTYTTEIEQVSVDECYMDFTTVSGKYCSSIEGALEIKNKIAEKFGFTVNIGISNNKLLAKMASDFEKPNKVHTLFPEEVSVKMWPLPVSELYMAGRSSVAILQKLEIKTIGELAQTDPSILEMHLKSHGRKLWEFANGVGQTNLESEPPEAKGIGNSVTLPKDVSTKADALPVLDKLSQSVGRRLRKSGQKAGMISVEIKYHNFSSCSHQKQLSRASAEDKVLYNMAVVLFEELWDGEPVRLLGIRTSKLVEEGEPEQMTLFDLHKAVEEGESRKRHQKLNQALEDIRKRFGEDAVKKGL